ncbi:MAG: hypothetical protein H8E12_07905 [Rhodobacteraceae bacterium]|nr:hypothetical protein [Paracoccaceae bacterium]
MFNIGDKVEYWYRMGRIGEIIGTETRGNNTMLEGGTFSNIVDILVKFEDGKVEKYPISDLRLADG